MSDSTAVVKKEMPPSKVFLYGIIVKNPILVQVIGLCPVVAASASVKVAALLSSVLIVLLVLCEVLTSALMKSVPRWFRVVVYMILGLLTVAPVMAFLDRFEWNVGISAGIYLPLMASSSTAALRCEKFAVRSSVRISLCDALATGFGTALVLMLSGIVRELLGLGSVAGKMIFSEPPVPALQMPFGGFVILGFFAAFLKWFISVFLTGYSYDMSFKIKKPSKNQPAEKQPPKSDTKPAEKKPAQKITMPSSLPPKSDLPETPVVSDTVPDGENPSVDSVLTDDMFTDDLSELTDENIGEAASSASEEKEDDAE